MELIKSDIDIPFRFTERPTPLAGDLRPGWRIAFILLMLLNSRGHKATLQKMHLLNSAARTPSTRRVFLRFVNGSAQKDEIVPRVEPSLIRAVNLAHGEGLVEIEKGRSIKLTASGLNAARLLAETNDCLVVEKEFLMAIKQFATEGNVENLFTWNI